jgi:hypothetical protein
LDELYLFTRERVAFGAPGWPLRMSVIVFLRPGDGRSHQHFEKLFGHMFVLIVVIVSSFFIAATPGTMHGFRASE